MGKPLPHKPRPPGSPPLVSLADRERSSERWLVAGILFFVPLPVVMAVVYATGHLHHYGYGVFVAVPIATGLAAALIYNHGREWKWAGTCRVVFLTLLVAGLWLLMARNEGAICLLMAGVLSWINGMIGLGIAWIIRRVKARKKTMLFLVLGLVPFTMGFEYAVKPVAPLLQQTTIIEVDAPPDVVWHYVPAFPAIQTPPTGLLSLDMAYPIASEMDGSGVGASRRCVLSTGAMPETVTAWEPGHRLEFDVLSTPPAMTETNPFGPTKTDHTEGYFQVQRGRFLLTALPGGRTRIEGTSWFHHNLWPQAYWAPLTQRVVKEVHLRVLEHIKQLAEAETR